MGQPTDHPEISGPLRSDKWPAPPGCYILIMPKYQQLTATLIYNVALTFILAVRRKTPASV